MKDALCCFSFEQIWLTYSSLVLPKFWECALSALILPMGLPLLTFFISSLTILCCFPSASICWPWISLAPLFILSSTSFCCTYAIPFTLFWTFLVFPLLLLHPFALFPLPLPIPFSHILLSPFSYHMLSYFIPPISSDELSSTALLFRDSYSTPWLKQPARLTC